eukprot:8252908-Pyramimonas_sp.AAC.1
MGRASSSREHDSCSTTGSEGNQTWMQQKPKMRASADRKHDSFRQQVLRKPDVTQDGKCEGTPRKERK